MEVYKVPPMEMGKWPRRRVEKDRHGLATAGELKPASNNELGPIAAL